MFDPKVAKFRIRWYIENGTDLLLDWQFIMSEAISSPRCGRPAVILRVILTKDTACEPFHVFRQ